jgi:hypothetical protein
MLFTCYPDNIEIFHIDLLFFDDSIKYRLRFMFDC